MEQFFAKVEVDAISKDIIEEFKRFPFIWGLSRNSAYFFGDSSSLVRKLCQHYNIEYSERLQVSYSGNGYAEDKKEYIYFKL